VSYRDQTDPIVDALRAIAIGETVPALEAQFGAETPAIRRAFGYPIPLAQLGTMELPAVSFYVATERVMPFTGRHRDRRLDVVVEYVGPVTAYADLDATWPILRTVWGSLHSAVEAGKVSGTDVLRLLGVAWVADEQASVEYDLAPGGEGAFPYFVGRFWLQWRPSEFDPSVLPDLAELYANLDLYQNGSKTKDNLVTVRGTV
jgi:hypothetical protein